MKGAYTNAVAHLKTERPLSASALPPGLKNPLIEDSDPACVTAEETASAWVRPVHGTKLMPPPRTLEPPPTSPSPPLPLPSASSSPQLAATSPSGFSDGGYAAEELFRTLQAQEDRIQRQEQTLRAMLQRDANARAQPLETQVRQLLEALREQQPLSQHI